MTVKEFSDKLNLKYLTSESKATEREINGCYCGDLLSWVMSRAKEDNIWLTVMGNINSIGVAVLTDVSCIVLTENAPLDDNAKEKAEQNAVIILTTDKTSYEVAAEFSEI
ncbi:MAG: AraC family transcriptional regulator [Ruminococcaceae bacterium]|nr:AraC family transcriptional regulator [Oscillospiraceae bacterium]